MTLAHRRNQKELGPLPRLRLGLAPRNFPPRIPKYIRIHIGLSAHPLKIVDRYRVPACTSVFAEGHRWQELGFVRPRDHLIKGGKLRKVGEDVRRYPCIGTGPMRRHGARMVEFHTPPVAQHLVAVPGRFGPDPQRDLISAYPRNVARDRRCDELSLEFAIMSHKDFRHAQMEDGRTEPVGRTHGRIGAEIILSDMVYRHIVWWNAVQRTVEPGQRIVDHRISRIPDQVGSPDLNYLGRGCQAGGFEIDDADAGHAAFGSASRRRSAPTIGIWTNR